MNVFMMKRARARREARWDATGEGSRGGHIIGHTSSGKPIYSTHGHAAHKGFDRMEHHAAKQAHQKNLHEALNALQLKHENRSKFTVGKLAGKSNADLNKIVAHSGKESHKHSVDFLKKTPKDVLEKHHALSEKALKEISQGK